MGVTTNKEGQPIAYHRDNDEPVGSAAFQKVDPYDQIIAGDLAKHRARMGYDGGVKVREAFPEKDCCNVTVENTTYSDYPINSTEGQATLLHNADGTYTCGPLMPLRSFRYPGTLAELTTYVQKFFGNGIDVIREKNQRYAGTVDPFKNFRLGGTYGIAIRMSDKVSRLLTLLEPGTTIAATSDESIEDTCQDLANYCAILSAMRRNESGQ